MRPFPFSSLFTSIVMTKKNTFPTELSKKQVIVLVITLFVVPLLWGTGTFGISVDMLFPEVSRPSFWRFVTSVMLLQWMAFGLIYWAIKPNMSTYLNISTSFLRRYKALLIILVLVILVAAFMAPSYLYESGLPPESLTLRWLGPVASSERIAFVFLSVTAGICEEVIFRGYGISVLERLTGNRWIALVVSSAAFMSLHGIVFIPVPLMIQYFIIGLIFGYVYQRFRRLEILILIHFLIDALIAVIVP